MITPKGIIAYRDLYLNAKYSKKKENMITLEQFKQGKIAINTRTQEEYDSLMRFFDSKNDSNFVWGLSTKPTKDNFFSRFREVCINSNFVEERSCLKNDRNSLAYSNKAFYEKEGYKIITPNQLKEYNEFICKNCKIINKQK